jgi:RNA polymerase sigma-70 factor (ECF subfamily)
VQARIAAEHVAGSTDWIAVAGWYDALAEAQPTPAVRLNRAVAHGYAFGPSKGLALLSHISDMPETYVLAVQADLTARGGDRVRATALFREAAARAPSEVERLALLARADEIVDGQIVDGQIVDGGPELSGPAG